MIRIATDHFRLNGRHMAFHRQSVVCCDCEVESPASVRIGEVLDRTMAIHRAAEVDGFVCVQDGRYLRNLCGACWENRGKTERFQW